MGHTGPETSVDIGRVMGKAIAKRIEVDRTDPPDQHHEKKGHKSPVKLLLALFSLAELCGLAECFARWTDPGSRSDRWEKHTALLEDLPEREAFLRDRKKAERYQRMVYHDYYLLASRPFRSEHINFLETYYSAMPCPDSAPADRVRERVWFFGGSIVENFTTSSDTRMIANQTIKYLVQNGIPAAGYNFGVRSFFSVQESIRFQDLLRREPESRHPGIAVFYDGYNDTLYALNAGPGNIPPVFYSNPVRLLVERRHLDLVRYSLAELLKKYSIFCKRFVAPHLLPPLFKQKKHPGSVPWKSMLTGRWRSICGTRVCSRRCAGPSAFDRCLSCSRLVVTKQKRLGDFEQTALAEIAGPKRRFIRMFYERLRRRMGDHPHFLDLSHVLDHNGRSDFMTWAIPGPIRGRTSVGRWGCI